jgi:uncharacterized protein
LTVDDDFLDYVPPSLVPSPCVGVCRIDSASRSCQGCGRTLSEIAEWPDATDARRQAILDRIAASEA